MTKITAQTIIAAPISVCFTTSLDLDVELEAAKNDRIEAIAGVTSGIIRAGETVTWQTRQFGIQITHTTLISHYQDPVYFQDSMVKGLFASFEHDHFFIERPDGKTEMSDEMRFSMPIYLLGKMTEILVVKRLLMDLLLKRNAIIKARCEASV